MTAFPRPTTLDSMSKRAISVPSRSIETRFPVLAVLLSNPIMAIISSVEAAVWRVIDRPVTSTRTRLLVEKSTASLTWEICLIPFLPPDDFRTLNLESHGRDKALGEPFLDVNGGGSVVVRGLSGRRSGPDP